ncbi:hypothetical protein K438DRAFT_2029495, partial [Mycena galopus ATCC 62051]
MTGMHGVADNWRPRATTFDLLKTSSFDRRVNTSRHSRVISMSALPRQRQKRSELESKILLTPPRRTIHVRNSSTKVIFYVLVLDPRSVLRLANHLSFHLLGVTSAAWSQSIASDICLAAITYWPHWRESPGKLIASPFPHTPTPIRPCEYSCSGSSFSSFFFVLSLPLPRVVFTAAPHAGPNHKPFHFKPHRIYGRSSSYGLTGTKYNSFFDASVQTHDGSRRMHNAFS